MSWVEQARTVLENDHVRLRPLTGADHDALHAIAVEPAIWRYFLSTVTNDAEYEEFFTATLADHEAGRRVVFVIEDLGSGTVAGSASFANFAEKDARLEIGWSWLGLPFQGKGINRWAKYLLLRHAFEELGALRVEFKTDVLNLQARQGLRNIGAVEEGVLRSFNWMPGGRRRDAIYYSVLAQEWPVVKQALETHAKVPPRDPA